MSLRSLAMILPIHLHLQSLRSTCATVILQFLSRPLRSRTLAYAPLHTAETDRSRGSDLSTPSKQKTRVPLPVLSSAGALDESNLGLEKVGPQALMATLDKIRPHQIALTLRVILQSPSAQMLSRYLCDTETPDSAHTMHDIQIQDNHGEMQRVRTLIDWGPTSGFMIPRLLKKPRISHEAAHTTTSGLGEQLMQHAKDSQKTSITVQYMEHLARVTEVEVLVGRMRAYDPVLGTPWCGARNQEID